VVSVVKKILPAKTQSGKGKAVKLPSFQGELYDKC